MPAMMKASHISRFSCFLYIMHDPFTFLLPLSYTHILPWITTTVNNSYKMKLAFTAGTPEMIVTTHLKKGKQRGQTQAL